MVYFLKYLDMNMEFKYNYVICGDDGYYKVGYHDIIGLPNVCYHESYLGNFNSNLSRGIVRFNFSRKVNKYIKTPFSKYVYPRLYPHNFDEAKPLCYIFFGHLVNILSTSYLDYLKWHNPNVKLVLFFQDLVKRYPKVDISKCKQLFDLVLSYDKGDCEKYGLLYHPTPMSYVDIQDDLCLEEVDVYFCGRAKGRYDLICKVFKKCMELGLKCDYHILSLPNDEERLPEIKYETSLLSYEENLKRMYKSKIILEIMAPGASGFTPRLWEAIVYDKFLLTNNNNVFTSTFYKKERIMHIDEFLEIDHKTLIEKLRKGAIWSLEDKQNLSPVNLLKFLEDNL